MTVNELIVTCLQLYSANSLCFTGICVFDSAPAKSIVRYFIISHQAQGVRRVDKVLKAGGTLARNPIVRVCAYVYNKY